MLAAAFITLGLDPLVRWFERRGMKRGVAIVTVIILFILVIAGMLWLVLPLADLADGRRSSNRCRRCSQNMRAQDWFQDASSGSGGVLSVRLHVDRGPDQQPDTSGRPSAAARSTSASRSSAGSRAAFFIFILTIYFTATLDSSKAAIYTLISASHRERVVGYAERIMQNVGRYLSGMVVLAFFNATYSLILLLARAACRSHS